MYAITRTDLVVQPHDMVSTDAGTVNLNRPFTVTRGTVCSVSALATSGDARTILRHNGRSFRIAHEGLIEVI